MLRKMLRKISIPTVLLSAFLVQAEDAQRGHASFDVRDENIGFNYSPNPISDECLLPQIIFGTTTTVHHGSVVEPSIAVNPKHAKYVVAVWQQDRIYNGGALDIGIARSKDGGKTWKQSLMPFQDCNGGFCQRTSDVWLSYSSDGSIVYLTGLPINATQDINTQNQEGIVVSFSEDNGKTWSIPHFVASSGGYLNEPTGLFALDDKNSVTADPNIAYNAYVVWDRFPEAISFHSDTFISRTTNGGLSWSPLQLMYDPFPDLTAHSMSNGIYNDCQTINNIIVGLPNGNLLNFMSRVYAAPGATDDDFVNDTFPYQFTLFDIAFVLSTDQGVTWTPDATIVSSFDDNFTFTGGYTYDGSGNITGGVGAQTRTLSFGGIPAVNQDNGNLYVVWQSGQFRMDQLPQIALSTSRDGGNTWSSPVQVNRTPSNTINPQAFTPSVAVAKGGYVGILYHDFRNDNLSDPVNNTLTDVWFALYKEVSNPNGGSTGVGLDFVKEVRVSKQSYVMQNGPTTSQGIMTNGDYCQLVAHDDDFFAIYVKSYDGPFSDPITIFDEDGTVLLLDDNKRTAPYFSKIDS
jgi:hypothetical protein